VALNSGNILPHTLLNKSY